MDGANRPRWASKTLAELNAEEITAALRYLEEQGGGDEVLSQVLARRLVDCAVPAM
jgi:hypothetical protein